MWRLWVGLAFAVWFTFGYYTGQWVQQQRHDKEHDHD